MKILRWISVLPATLRWVLVLPAALFVPTIIIAGLNLILLISGLTNWVWSLPSIGPFSADKSLLGLVVEYASFGLISVYSGVLMAPSAKRVVAVVLTSFFYLYLGVQIYIVVTFSEAIVSSFPVVYGIVGAAAASYAAFQVFRDEELPHLFELNRS